MVASSLRAVPVVLLLLVSSAAAAPPPADLTTVLARAATAAAALHENLPGIMADETYEQVASGSSARWKGRSQTSTLRWAFDPASGQWRTSRDVQAVTGESGVVPGPSQVTPMDALMALLPEYQPRFQFVHGGVQRIGTTRVFVVGFREVGRPTLFRDPEGRSLPVSGVLDRSGLGACLQDPLHTRP